MLVRFAAVAALIGLLGSSAAADELVLLPAPPAAVQPAAGLALQPAPGTTKDKASVGVSHHYLLWFWVVVGAVAVTATVVSLATPPAPKPYVGNFEAFHLP